MELTREEDRKFQRAIIHTAGRYNQEDLNERSEEEKKVIENYMAAWEPPGSIVFPLEMVEILGDMKKEAADE